MTKLTRLGDVVDLLTGFPFKSAEFVEEPTSTRLLRGDNIAHGALRWDGVRYWPRDKVSDFGKYTLVPGDVIVAMDRPWISSGLKWAEVRDTDLPCLLVQRVARLRAKGPLEQPFLPYLISGKQFSDYVQGVQTGTAVPHISSAQIEDFRFRCPSGPEQRAIAAVLGALDDKIAINERIAATADELSRALFAREFSASATPVPRDGWVSGHLSDICSTQYGYTASSTSDPVGPKFLRVKDINKRNWVNWTDVPHCEIGERDLEKYRLSVGDVLVARMADPGKSAIVEESTDAVFASYLVRLKTPSLAHSYFVWGFLKSDDYANYAESSRGGSVQANMNAKVIVGAQLSIPPVEVMQRYLRLIAPVRQRLTLALRGSRSLVALRDALLPQLMSGRLRVKDAEKIVEDHT
ncbi:restriction endonuclease subunit S [Streptomyces sp. NPDC006539]|uniref:restriction endonuclease subunit S n=1 Tax=Streptomyces sp. NPDC006539 TaxID=3155352 RepID=UPI0033BEECD4